MREEIFQLIQRPPEVLQEHAAQEREIMYVMNNELTQNYLTYIVRNSRKKLMVLISALMDSKGFLGGVPYRTHPDHIYADEFNEIVSNTFVITKWAESEKHKLMCIPSWHIQQVWLLKDVDPITVIKKLHVKKPKSRPSSSSQFYASSGRTNGNALDQMDDAVTQALYGSQELLYA